jgi:hypothetical protein
VFHVWIVNAQNLRNNYLDFSSEFQIFIEKDPRMVTDPKTHILALKQTIYARNLIYHPNNILENQLRDAAGKLSKFLDSLDTILISALGARLLNKEGILAGQSEKYFTNSLKRVAGYLPNPSANDRLVTIALMGDLGALYADTGVTTGVYGRTSEQAQILRDKFKQFVIKFSNEVDYFADDVVKQIKNSRGSSAVGPNKSKERKRINDEARTGIFNYGDRADEN